MFLTVLCYANPFRYTVKYEDSDVESGIDSGRTRRERFNLSLMGGNSISPAHLRVRPMVENRTCR